MRRYAVCCILLLTALFSSCSEQGVTAPALPNGQKDGNDPGHAEACHQNMTTIASQCVIYYAMHGTYPENLYDLGTPYGSLTCPQCQSLYIYQGDQQTFSIWCPLPSQPTHGCIVDGIVSWPPTQGGAKLCRSNMRTIASACVLFFAQHSSYPETLDELGPPFDRLTCFDCGLPYVYYSYDLPTDGDGFFVGCPLTTDPNHGHIRDGILSWVEP